MNEINEVMETEVIVDETGTTTNDVICTGIDVDDSTSEGLDGKSALIGAAITAAVGGVAFATTKLVKFVKNKKAEREEKILKKAEEITKKRAEEKVVDVPEEEISPVTEDDNSTEEVQEKTDPKKK